MAVGTNVNLMGVLAHAFLMGAYWPMLSSWKQVANVNLMAVLAHAFLMAVLSNVILTKVCT